MNLEWFIEIVDEWSPPLELSPEVRRSCATDLMAISRAYGGLVIRGSAGAELEKRHAQSVCLKALDSLARHHANQFRRGSLRPQAVYPRDTADADTLAFITPSALRARVDLNTASGAAIAALPGIGADNVARIVEWRRRRGPFSVIQDLSAIKGIGPDELRSLKQFAYVGKRRTAAVAFHSPEFTTFLASPTFRDYIHLLAAHKLGPRQPAHGKDDLAEQVAFEIASYRQYFEATRTKRRFWDWGVSADALGAKAALEERGARVRSRVIGVNAEGVLLDDSAYPAFIENLIKTARQAIRIIMFFAKFEAGGKYPTSAIFNALVAARAKGVDVKVILDQDAGDSAIKSRQINQAAYDFLTANRIDVQFEGKEKFTHSKVVVVDGTHVVVGSHNWTAGSFYAYQDTSVYLRSAALAAHYTKRFSNFWDGPQQKGSRARAPRRATRRTSRP